MRPVSDIGPPPALLSRAQEGDRQAMNQLLASITPYVSRVCRSVTPADAADATQEALIAVYRGLRTLREPNAFYGWVRSVTVREAVRTARRTGNQGTQLCMEVRQDISSLDAVHITDVLDRLSASHRQILMLRAYGLNEEELAQMLSLPVGTVRSRLHRARLRFREAWLPPKG